VVPLTCTKYGTEMKILSVIMDTYDINKIPWTECPKISDEDKQ
jgi:hypothetical protein